MTGIQHECYVQTKVKDHLLRCLQLPEWKNHPDYEMLKVDYYTKIIKINKFLLTFAR